MRFVKVLIVVMLAGILVTPCLAQITPNGVPNLIEYHGKLSKPTGSPYPNGIYDITFEICTDESCTTPSIWSEIHTIEISMKNKKDLDGGTSYEAAFTVILGSLDPLNLAFEEDYYLHSFESILGYENMEQLTSVPYAIRSDFSNYADTAYDSNDDSYKDVKAIKVSNAFEADNADTLDEKHYSDIAKEINDDVTAHANLKATHGVTGDIVGTTDNQTLTNKHISGEQIDSGKINNDRLNMGHENEINADKLDGKHYFNIADEIDADINAHANLKATHGVTGEIVGTENDQTLLNKHISGEQIDSGKINNARLNMGKGNGLNADMVDDLHASATPEPNKLLTLNESGQFPDSVIPDGITIDKASDSYKLGGEEPSYYAIATHAHSFSDITGTITDDKVPNNITIDYATSAGYATNAGNAANAGNANTLNGYSYSTISSQMTTKINQHESNFGHLTQAQMLDLTNGGETSLHYHAVTYASNAGDADTLDGKNSSAFALANHTHPSQIGETDCYWTELVGGGIGADDVTSGCNDGYYVKKVHTNINTSFNSQYHHFFQQVYCCK